ncbi:MAG: DUF5723 family protein [Flavobacteriales bacterium]|jgi:hypothetical protein|nr:DUF5723 family protein [Flavobacteriales bacterium]
MKKNILALVLLLAVVQISFAQHHKPLIQYNVDFLPGSAKQNPAHGLRNSYFFGVPVLGSVELNAYSNTLTFSDVIRRVSEIKTIIDLEHINDKIDDQTFVNTEFSTEVLYGGLRAYDGGYWSFGLDLSTKVDFNFSDGLFDLLIYGNVHEKNIDRTLDFSAFKPEVMAYSDLHVGYSRDLNKSWRVGARLHILSGLAFVGVSENSMTFKTNSENKFGSIDANGRMAFSMAGLDLDADIPIGLSPINFRNLGLGLDLGVDYMLNKKIYLSAVMTELGFISWGDNAKTHSINFPENFKYDGFKIQLNTDDDLDEIIDQWREENRESTQLDTNEASFSSTFAPRVTVGAKYRINRKNFVNLQLSTKIQENRTFPSASLIYQSSVFSFLDVIGGVNYFNNDAGISAGVNFNVKSVNLYLMTDNVLAFSNPRETKGTNFAFGVNVQIVEKRRKAAHSRTRWMSRDVKRKKDPEEEKKKKKRKEKEKKKKAKEEAKNKKEAEKEDKADSKKEKKRKRYKKKRAAKNEL